MPPLYVPLPNSLDAAYQAARFWAIDPVNGDDTSIGWGSTQVEADSRPIKTMTELNRRISGAVYGDGVTVVFHQLSDMPSGGGTVLNIRVEGTGYALWLGTKTLVYTGAVTTYTAANQAGNAAAQLQLNGLTTSWTADGTLRKLIESGDGLRAAWAVADLGSKTARITTPCTSLASTKTIASAASVFTAAETVNIYSLTTIPVWPFPASNVLTAGVQYCDFTTGTSNAGRNDIGSGSPYITRCLNHAEWKANASIDGIRWSCNLVDMNSFTLINGGGKWLLTFGGCNGIIAGGGTRAWTFGDGSVCLFNHGDMIFENCGFSLNAVSSLTGFATDSHLGVFNYGGTMLTIQDAAASGRVIRMNVSTYIYGTGNSGTICNVPKGVSVTLPVAAQCPVVTSGTPLIVAGVNKVLADMPISDAANLASITN